MSSQEKTSELMEGLRDPKPASLYIVHRKKGWKTQNEKKKKTSR